METATPRKLFTIGELMTLGGLILTVMSAALTWANVPPKLSTMAAAAYVAKFQRDAYLTNGYGLKLAGISVGWIVVLASLAAGSLMLFTPTPEQRRKFLIGQVAAGIVIFALAILHVGPYWGIFMALAGSALMIAGGVMRYGGATER
jgi:hypothetical protein